MSADTPEVMRELPALTVARWMRGIVARLYDNDCVIPPDLDLDKTRDCLLGVIAQCEADADNPLMVALTGQANAALALIGACIALEVHAPGPHAPGSQALH